MARTRTPSGADCNLRSAAHTTSTLKPADPADHTVDREGYNQRLGSAPSQMICEGSPSHPTDLATSRRATEVPVWLLRQESRNSKCRQTQMHGFVRFFSQMQEWSGAYRPVAESWL